MIKTQVYIPEDDNVNLLETARLMGIKKSEVLRQAVSEFCQKNSRLRCRQVIQRTAGALKKSPLDAQAIRRQTNEGFRA